MKKPRAKVKTKKRQIVAKSKKQFDAAAGQLETGLTRSFGFLGVWQRSVKKWLQRQGAAIARVSPPWLRRVGRIVWRPFGFMGARIRLLLARRPHRSFRLTRRRDYKRSLKLPGYWSFTNSVRSMLWKNRRLFGGIALSYLAVIFIVNSFGQQDAYQNLSNALYDAGGEFFEGNWGRITGAGILLFTSVTQGLTPNVTEAQTVLSALAVFFAWLATVWALRNVMAGRKVKVRDAVYSSGSPVIPSVLVSFIIVLQILPLSLAILVYNAAIVSGFISGVEAMLAWVAVALLGVLSIYWITSTIIALIIITLPGMYPWRAIQTAGDLVVGRRLRILLRLIWLAFIVVVAWAIIVIPIILFDDWIKDIWSAITWLPIVPVSILIMSSLTIVFVATYIYMLYRKVVDDDAKPA